MLANMVHVHEPISETKTYTNTSLNTKAKLHSKNILQQPAGYLCLFKKLWPSQDMILPTILRQKTNPNTWTGKKAIVGM